ncbi:MAG: bifunctional 4-hydroxy-2-oxoglutarate aldolase/2-dehydro-3-deoxy-phosphogluconate aldolase [Pirellula sp.]|jgi:2-dehydro-3-deoxyphosphogluconate aldolase/(4S)-4-hydroxy-2-oxoglutarate aldolase
MASRTIDPRGDKNDLPQRLCPLSCVNQKNIGLVKVLNENASRKLDFVSRKVNEIVELVLQHRLVAILRLPDLTDAIPLVQALLDGGVRLIEFTLTNPDAGNAVARCRRDIKQFDHGEAAIGIGSVRTVDEAKLALDSGCQFVVTPIYLPAVIKTCKNANMMICSGAFTPTEIYNAHLDGSEIVKVFPARDLGPNYIKDVLAPMPFLKLMPTGGVDLSNVQSYFDAGAVAVGVGGQFVDRTAIKNRDWLAITKAAQQFVQATSRP